MKNILSQYQILLENVDRWFDHCMSSPGAEINCRRACTGCCRGLFEISVLDARFLQEGFSQLSRSAQKRPLALAHQRLSQLQEQWPEFQHPFILNLLPHNNWQEMPEDDATLCPLLSEDGLCLVYAHRPMTCRLHGLPNIDISGESFSDAYCSLNFKESDPLSMTELRWEFRATFRREFDLLSQFSHMLTGTKRLELDTFIPTALLIDFSSPDWQQLPDEEKPRES